MALFLFVKAALEGKKIDVYNHGEMLRDFTYIDDIVNGVIKVIDSKSTNDKSVSHYKIYNIGNNNPIKLMDFILAIEKKLNINIRKNLMPIQPGDVVSTYADVSGLEKDFNYKPNTPISIGISKFVDWYIKYYKITQ
jgi:UDP-glucuronate 4-epimerase